MTESIGYSRRHTSDAEFSPQLSAHSMSSIARLSLLAVALPLAASLAVAPVASSTARLAPLQPRALASPSATRGLAPTYSAARLPQLMMQEAAAVPPAGFMTHFKKFSNVFSNLFPLWTASVAGIGLMAPGVFTGISTEYFTGLLGLLMLSMGITLTVDDFKRVLQRPAIMVLGFAACYVLMPALALGLSNLIGLPAALTAGMVLVGSINGGQASNLCAYIAKGDVALSVLMTTCTTIGAIFMTPLICKVRLSVCAGPLCAAVCSLSLSLSLFAHHSYLSFSPLQRSSSSARSSPSMPSVLPSPLSRSSWSRS